MTPNELPDAATVPMAWVREFFVLRADLAANRDMSTAELALELGHSQDWWRRKAPLIPGAYKASKHSPYYIPKQAAQAFLDGQKKKASGRRAQAVPARQMVGRRFAPMGRAAAHAQGR